MFSSFSLISLYKRFGSLLCSIFFVLWLCKKQKTKKRLFEQDGYKTFGEKNVGGFLLQICDLTSFDDGEHFYEGYMNNLKSFGAIHKNALFKVLWHF